LAKLVMKKFNLTTQDVKLVHIGGTGQLEPYNAMLQGLTREELQARASKALTQAKTQAVEAMVHACRVLAKTTTASTGGHA